MNDTNPEQIQIPELSYFAKRMAALGVTEELNNIDLEVFGGVGKDTVLKPTRIFRETERGIDILVYTIDGLRITYAKGDSRHKNFEYTLTRLEHPLISKKGDPIKYLMPKDQPTQPFFPPALVSAFRKKTKINTLVITEGYFKAFKASMHGMYCVGLSSITHMKEKNGNLHEDIRRLIIACAVENVIWLMDGDCMSLTQKDLTDGIDLYKKPKDFFSTVNAFKDLMSEFENVKKYTAHILSEEISDKDPAKDHPKGIDDLLCAFPGEESYYVNEVLNLSKKPKYFYREDITFGLAKVHRHFMLDHVDNFVIHHGSARPDIYNIEFKFNGTLYKWNEEKKTCEVIVPGESKNYFRVGDQFYSFVYIPNKHNEIERTFHRRMKGTICDDHGKNIIKHIPKYQAFCNVPDHVNHQAVIHNCFNMYAPCEHEPEEGEFPVIEKFFKHIFGTGDIKWTDPQNKETDAIIINELDLGYDYFTQLYTNPTQILPILCLVSKENNTGKSTLGKLMKLMFTQNAAVVGNAELADNFNASWASKLLIICDETKIDKQVVVEKVKSLSTTDKIFMNAKGKDHIELDFFGKFVFCTNNEENFIYASAEDVRYWIRKVPRLDMANLDVHMLQRMQEEIPAFIHFLNTRKMKVPNRHRAWFDPDLIKTDALKKVVMFSKSSIEKHIRAKVRFMFFEFGCQSIWMSFGDIKKEFELRQEDHYIERTLREDLKVDTYGFYPFEGHRYETLAELLKVVKPEDAKDIKKKSITKRYSYPRWERITVDQGKHEIRRVDVSGIGRPYIFHIHDFLTAEEIESIETDAEMKQANDLHDNAQQRLTFATSIEDDTPPWVKE